MYKIVSLSQVLKEILKTLLFIHIPEQKAIFLSQQFEFCVIITAKGYNLNKH